MPINMIKAAVLYPSTTPPPKHAVPQQCHCIPVQK